MKLVSPFEANLLNILRFFLRKAPAAQALPLLAAVTPPPRCLSRPAVELVQDTLAKGCLQLLVHAHGWRRERFLRNGQIAEGRLWERTPPQELGLTFSKHSLRFLMWVTATALPRKQRSALPTHELTVADWLLFYYAYGALRGTPAIEESQNMAQFARNPLCRLVYADDFSAAPAEPLDFGLWTIGVGACILEALQGELSGRWITMERNKTRLSNGERQRGLGRSQECVLDQFLDAVEAEQRRDLARFVLQAARAILDVPDNPYGWMEDLNLASQRLSERMETYRVILALPRQLARLHIWDQQARGIGYHDEDYAISQFWKTEWEQARGEPLYLKAQALVRRWEEWR